MINNMSGLLVMFLCYLFVRCTTVEGVANLSQEEDLELEEQIRLLNKPVIKSIKTDYGDIYDCVDFYKQPAFDHPLLKNHSYHFQMKPPSESAVGKKTLSAIKRAYRSFPNETLRRIGLKDGGCPVGTVLIKRITKEDLIREKLASKVSNGIGGTITSVARTKNAEQYTGVLGNFAIYNPVATGQQNSVSRIKVQNGNEFLKFGWRVDPTLYGDSRTHIFIQTNTDSAKCFDSRCGFVVTARTVTPGFPFNAQDISVPGKPADEILLRLQRKEDGNWWLLLEEDETPIGFWPSKLFSELKNFATYADWGGEVHSPQGIPEPEMGSGHRPSKNAFYDAYIRFITAFDSSGNGENPNTEGFDSESGPNDFYDIIDDPTSDSILGHIVYFGGRNLN